MKYFVCLIVIVAFVELSSCQRGSYSGMGSITANAPAPVRPAQAAPAPAPAQVTNNRIDSQNEVDSNFNNNNRQQFDINQFPVNNNWFGNVETVHHGNRRWRSVA